MRPAFSFFLVWRTVRQHLKKKNQAFWYGEVLLVLSKKDLTRIPCISIASQAHLLLALLALPFQMLP